MPWPLNVNCPFGCFWGCSLPWPFTRHLTSIFGQSDTVERGPQLFWLSPLCLAFHCSPLWHSYPTLNIILKLYGIGSVYFGMVHRLTSAVVFSLHCCHVCPPISSPSIYILRRSQLHTDIYRVVSALKCSFMFIGGSCSSFPVFFFFLYW